MDSLAQLNASLGRLSQMGPEEAFFHPDFVRALNVLRFPYLYDGKGTPVPQEALDLIIRISADMLCRMPPEAKIAHFNADLDRDLREYLLESLANAEITEQNARDFARAFMRMHEFSRPRFQNGDLGAEGAYAPVSAYFEIHRKLLSFHSPGMCDALSRIALEGGAHPSSAADAFLICSRQSMEGVRLGHSTIMRLIRAGRGLKQSGEIGALERHGIEEGLAHLGKKAREFDEARQEFLARLRRDVVRAEMARVIRISTFVAVRELQKRREIRRMSLLHPGRLRQCGGRY